MRIVYLHQYFNTPDMSGGTRSYEMARRLVAAGHEVHMVTSQRDGQFVGSNGWVETNEAGIHVHWTPVPYSNKMGFGKRIKAFLSFARRSAHRAAHLGGDVVFATSTPLTIALPAVYAARRNRIPMVFEVRDLWPELPIAVGALKGAVPISTARWLERFAYGNSTRIVALSPGMKDGVVATGYPADRVSMIPNSCDLDLFNVGSGAGEAIRARYEWLGERPLVIYAGATGMINGVDYLARVADRARGIDPDVRFVVMGKEGKQKEMVRQVARDLGVLDHNFFMIGSVPKLEMPGWLSAASMATSLFVDLKEMWANSANKFFDALAAGRPIAINYGGWQAGLLRETGAGLVLDPHRVDDAAASVVHAVRNEAWLREAGAAARRLARKQFDRDKLAVGLEQVLVEAVGEYRSEGTGRNP